MGLFEAYLGIFAEWERRFLCGEHDRISQINHEICCHKFIQVQLSPFLSPAPSFLVSLRDKKNLWRSYEISERGGNEQLGFEPTCLTNKQRLLKTPRRE
jgi:hypothetical protein